MFIAIFIAVLVAAGLGYFFMKHKKSPESPEDIAKDQVENLVKSMLRQMNDMLTATPDLDLEGSEVALALQATQTELYETLASVQQEFGITINTPIPGMAELERGVSVDVESVEIEWITAEV